MTVAVLRYVTGSAGFTMTDPTHAAYTLGYKAGMDGDFRQPHFMTQAEFSAYLKGKLLAESRAESRR